MDEIKKGELLKFSDKWLGKSRSKGYGRFGPKSERILIAASNQTSDLVVTRNWLPCEGASVQTYHESFVRRLLPAEESALRFSERLAGT